MSLWSSASAVVPVLKDASSKSDWQAVAVDVSYGSLTDIAEWKYMTLPERRAKLDGFEIPADLSGQRGPRSSRRTPAPSA